MAPAASAQASVPPREAEQARGAPLDRDGAPDIVRILEQLGGLLDDETRALRSGEHGVLAGSSFRKGHAFLELNRALSAPLARGREPQLAGLVNGLRQKLELNRRVLKLHLDAAQEVSAVLSGAMQEADWDGTYTRAISG